MKKIDFESLDSTNTWAKEHAFEFDPSELTIITADEQTGGRGRFKRTWVSPKGCNIYTTYVFFLDQLNENIGNYPQILALSAYEILKQYHQEVQLKWPNDLVIHKKKCGGILCELEQVHSKWAVILGIGLNINMPKVAMEVIDRPATSLQEELNRPLDRHEIAEKLHQNFQQALKKFQQLGFALFYPLYKNALGHKRGDLLKFSNFKETIGCTFDSVNPDGSITCYLTDGGKKRFATGELL